MLESSSRPAPSVDRLRQLVKPVIRPVRQLLDNLHEHHEIAILQARARGPGSRQFKILERSTEPAAVLEACSVLDRPMSAQRIDQRISHGLRYFEMYIADRLAATTWIISSGTRYFDEVAYHFPIPSKSIWIRDIFISPDFRGRRLLGTFLDELVGGPLIGTQMLWSDVNIYNIASMKAHSQYGFCEVTRYRRRCIGRLFLTRDCDMPDFHNLNGYQSGRRIIFTGPRFRKYTAEHIA